VTRALGRPSVVGVGEGVTADWAGRDVTVDGSSGVVYAGRLPTRDVPVDEIPGLGRPAGWARALSPVRIVEDAADVLDLDAAGVTVTPEAAPDVDELARRMRGAAAVRGSILGTAEGARALVRSGVPAAVPLPGQHPAALLLRFARERSADVVR
jgi:pyruvate,orthophosphate dikinase